MVYNYHPIEKVIAKITRDMMLAETGYTAFMPEWIAEAIRKMSGTRQHVFSHKDVRLCWHKGKMPCHLRILDGVSYCGHRLRYRDIEATGIRMPRGPVDYPGIRYSIPTIAPDVVDPDTDEIEPNPTKYWNDLVKLPWYTGDAWYSVEPGHVLSNLPDCEVRLHFRALPHDARGLPLVPDHVDAQEAIYLYVRMKMIGTGWKDPQFGLDDRLVERRFLDALEKAQMGMDNMTPDMFSGMGDAINRAYAPEGYSEGWSSYISPETYYL